MSYAESIIHCVIIPTERKEADPIIDQILDMIPTTLHTYGVVINDSVPGWTNDVEIASNWRVFLQDSKNILAVLTTQDLDQETLVGFSIAVPLNHMHPERQAADTAYIYATAIKPDYQHQGYVEPLSDALLNGLWELGYRYVERDIVISDNGYAKNVEKAFSGNDTGSPDSIVRGKHYYIHNPWGLGPQQHFRIDLGVYLGTKGKNDLII